MSEEPLEPLNADRKVGNQRDWDRADASVSLSALSFVANDGKFLTLNPRPKTIYPHATTINHKP